MIDFAAPLAFLLLPLPFLARRFLPPRARLSGAVRTPPAIAQAMRPPRGEAGRARILWAAPTLLWLCLVVALAGPRMMVTAQAMPASGRDIILAIDLSGSMEKQDFSLDGAPISRLDAVKRVGAAFARGRAGDRLGLVVFGDAAYFAAPLTFDVEAVAQAIEGAAIGVSGRSTAISDGLGLALKRLARSDARSRVVILLSDGVDTTGALSPLDVAALAATFGVRAHTIALGPQDLETAPNARDAVDIATLRAVAKASGGQTFRVRDMADLAQMAAALDALEPSPAKRPPMQSAVDLWIYPAMLAFALALLLALLRESEA